VLPRTFVAGLSIVAMLTLVAGCAGLSGTSSAPGPAALDAGSELKGTWRGTLGWVGAHQYGGESRLTLQIKEDGTFTATVTPNRGTNNLAHASTLSGTVVNNGNRVTLRNSQGPWSWLTLVRSGDTLYGVANDPAFEANVLLSVRREGGQASAAARYDDPN